MQRLIPEETIYENKYHLPKRLLASFIGFNGSANCDKTSPQNFYDSYIKTKKLTKKRAAFQWELIEQAEEHKDKLINLIAELF